ncbi:MAG: galactokinase [Bacillota bacterium]|jgi:galactokinase
MNPNETISAVFIRQFGPGGLIITGQAPGRVNLIGEHTDYNEGYVLPMALGFHMEMAGRLRADAVVEVYSADYDQRVEFSLTEPPEYDRERLWSNYIRGVCWALRETGLALSGVELAFRGNIPQGAGLSSSAALEVVTALIILTLCGLALEPSRIALLCQRAENEFVGTKCGVMDQFIAVMGQEERVMFLDCRTLRFELVPLELGDYRVVICHSGVKHQLVASEYNRRRQSCQAGVAVLQQAVPTVKALRDVDPAMLEQYRTALGPEIYRRCRHIVSENQRVLESIAALRRGELTHFGQLMNQSHDSLRDDYEVSCAEVDLLIDLARRTPGVLGARITGGGFGGCTVNLVAAAAAPRFIREVGQAYREQTGNEPRFFSCVPAGGAKIN